MKSNNFSQSSLLIMWAIASTFALNSLAINSFSGQTETANQSQSIVHRR